MSFENKLRSLKPPTPNSLHCCSLSFDAWSVELSLGCAYQRVARAEYSLSLMLASLHLHYFLDRFISSEFFLGASTHGHTSCNANPYQKRWKSLLSSISCNLRTSWNLSRWKRVDLLTQHLTFLCSWCLVLCRILGVAFKLYALQADFYLLLLVGVRYSRDSTLSLLIGSVSLAEYQPDFESEILSRFNSPTVSLNCRFGCQYA